jgi:SAM-dependent methyltransferase
MSQPHGIEDPWRGLEPGERPFREAARYYAEYRYRPSDAFVRLLATHLGWSRSDRVLDLGAGPAHVSLRIAPFVGEVIVMDPEEAMIEEGRRRAAAADVDNLSFILGGSDDLPRLTSELGELSSVLISQAFHWMADQDGVLRTLDNLVERKRGAVALIGFVKEPDYNRIWIDRSPWNSVDEILQRYLLAAPTGPNPGGRHDPFPEIFRRSAFSSLELLSYEHDVEIRPSIDAAIGYHYSLGNLLTRLEDRRAAFEADVRAALTGADTAPFTVRLLDSALVARRSNHRSPV